MSGKTWLREFYPIPADDPEMHQREDGIELIDHSIRKWSGLTKENLERHKVTLDSGGDVIEIEASGTQRQVLPIASLTCALCEAYIVGFCHECPLYLSRGGVRCDNPTEDEKVSNGGNGSPWNQRPLHQFDRVGSPEPMLRALEAAKAWRLENPKNPAGTGARESAT